MRGDNHLHYWESGRSEGISNDTILAGADPDDVNDDGISGRVRWLSDDQIGKMGWKAQIATVSDFVADALLQESGVTIHPSLSDFTIDNDFDTCEDPEFLTEDLIDLTFYVYKLGLTTKSRRDDKRTLRNSWLCELSYTITRQCQTVFRPSAT